MNKFVEKSWGYELWFENNEKYCGKLLFVEYRKWSSKGKFHYHPKKDETFFVVKGDLLLEIANEDGSVRRQYMPPKASIRIKPGKRHRFTSASLQGCEFVEVSTTHSDDDTIRESWNGTEWVTDDKDV